jgi:predicted DNA-binding transcriptional regulator AlpA
MNIKLLGIRDLTKRWSYSRQGIHQKQKEDNTFPKPIGKINEGRIQVFLEKDIIDYEQKNKELTDDSYKEWYQKKWCYSSKK